ncbi:MAG: tyrosine-type recombinase/integrase, partial [Pseudomonadota bacterium]|nr:tyrosine-type recombinase/integrase [Pseudomonadota bacterium]
MSRNIEPVLDQFTDSLWLEDGLSQASIDAYRSDLSCFSDWLCNKQAATLLTATSFHLHDFFSQMHGLKLSAATTGRRLASLRRFYQYCMRHGLVRIDPTGDVVSPKLHRQIPVTLSESDVERLLDAPDSSTIIGLRDKAMLEILYATGLRVSELVGLTVTMVHMDMGIVKVMGKGSKERLVPLGEIALEWAERYFTCVRPLLLNGEVSNTFFLTRRARKMTRQAFWY